MLQIAQDETLLRELHEAGVIQSDAHIILSSELHTRKYANFVPSKVPQHLREKLMLYLIRAATMRGEAHDGWVVVGMGCGGHWYAERLADHYGCDPLFAERNTLGRLVLRRDQGTHLRGKTVIIVDDVVSTGQSTCELGELIERYGGEVCSALFLLDRNSVRQQTLVSPTKLTIPVISLFHVPMETWTRQECPLCKKGIPFSTEHGKGADVFHRHGQPQPKP